MLDNLRDHDGIRDSARYVAPEVSYLFDRLVNVVFVGAPNAGDRGWVLVDAGLPGSASKIKRAAARLFGDGARPSAIILTHGHVDHIGAIHTLVDEWDVQVYAHPLELPYLTGRSAYPPPEPLVGGGVMPLASLLFPRGPIDLGTRVSALPPNGRVPGLPGWRWIPTPGHSPGHVSLMRDVDCTLIAGDAFVTTKQESLRAVLTQRQEMHGPPMYFTPDWDAARASVQRLADLGPAAAITGHGPPMHGAELQMELRRLSSHFDAWARPSRGRYRDEPARADASGVVSVPPAVISGRTVLLTALAVGGVVALGVALSGRRDAEGNVIASSDAAGEALGPRMPVTDERVAAGAALAAADGGYDGDTTYEAVSA